MKSLFSLDSPVMRVMNRVADIMLLNLLWIVFSVPVVTAGAATSAVYHVLFKMKTDEEGSVVKTFWQGFRGNFLPATKVFLILLLPMLLVLADGFMLVAGAFGNGVMNNVILALPVLVFSMVWTFVFPLVAKFENRAGDTVKNALLLCLAHLPKTLLMTALNLLPIVWMVALPMLFFRCAVIFFLGGFVCIAYVNSHFLHKIFMGLIENQTAETA